MYIFFFGCRHTLEKYGFGNNLYTINISPKQIHFFDENRRCVETGAPIPPNSGKNVKIKVDDELIQGMRHGVTLAML